MSNFEKKVVPYLTYLGTRPILQDELRQYELHHRARIAIKPGITGMWQVSGRSDITDFEEVVRLDTEYISKSDVLKFLLENNCSIVVRPSGTEPKLKTYISVSAENKEIAEKIEVEIVEAAETWIS